MSNVKNLRLTPQQILENAAMDLGVGDKMVVVTITEKGEVTVWGNKLNATCCLIASHKLTRLADRYADGLVDND
jgi:hypothetical protein